MDLSPSTKDRIDRPGEPLLDKRERRLLLEEIGRVALVVGRSLYPQQLANEFGEIDARTQTEAGNLSLQERLTYLEAYVVTVEKAVRLIAREPRSTLQPNERSVPLERSRRPLASGVLQALRHGNMRIAPADYPVPVWAAPLNGLLPRTISEPVHAVTCATPENRWVAALLMGWRADLREIAIVSAWLDEPAMRERAVTLGERYGRLLSAEFLKGPRPVAGKPTEGVLRDARYRALYELERRYRRLLGFAWSLPELRLPAREAWRLYEVWCFFKVVESLVCQGWQPAAGDAVRQTPRGLGVSLVKGKASRLVFRKEGAELSLFYNRAFLSAVVGSRQAASRTHTLVPDISLERGGRFLLLDPKYRSYAQPGDEQDETVKIKVTYYDAIRTNEGLLADVLKMHAYKDAIRRGDDPVVDAAWCLFAGDQKGGPAIIAYPESTSGEPFGRAAVGALRLRPGEDNSALVRLIASWSAG
jgi:hypothetical protein